MHDSHIDRDRYQNVAGPADPAADLRLGVLHSPEPAVMDRFAADGYDLLLNYGYPRNPVDGNHTGRVLAAQLDSNTFLLLGFDAQFRFMPTFGSGYRVAEIEAIEEGRFEGHGWVRQRIWNGDEAYYSVFPHEGAILRVKLRRM